MLTGRTLVDVDSGKVFLPVLTVTETRWEATVGLLGKGGLPAGEGLLIPGCGSVHTFFMRFALDLVYLDREMRVVKNVHNLHPWRVSFCAGAFAVLEMASGTLAACGLEPGVRVNHVSAAVAGVADDKAL